MEGTLRQQELEAGGYYVPNQKRQMEVWMLVLSSLNILYILENLA